MAVLQGTTQHIHVWQSQLQTWYFSCLTTNQCPSLSVHPCTHQTQCAALLKVKITFVRMERNFASLQEKVYIVCIIYIDLCLWPFMIIVVLNKPGLDLSFIKTCRNAMDNPKGIDCLWWTGLCCLTWNSVSENWTVFCSVELTLLNSRWNRGKSCRS